MIGDLIWMDRIKGETQFQILVERAKQDGHGVAAPTHVFTKAGEMVGYVSIGTPGVPLVLGWLDTKRVKARESMTLTNAVENFVALNGGMGLYTPVLKTSPFYPLMERMGYKNCGTYDLFLKEL